MFPASELKDSATEESNCPFDVAAVLQVVASFPVDDVVVKGFLVI